MIKLLSLLIISFAWFTVYSGINENSGQNGYDVLALGAGALPNSMAGAYTGASGDVYSLYWNPAGIASVNRVSFLADYMKYVLDMHRGMLGFVIDQKRVRNVATIGGYINYFTAGKFEWVDPLGERVSQNDFSAGYTEFCVAAARNLPEFFPGYAIAGGITAKGLLENIENYHTSAIGADIGVHCIFPGSKVKVGAVMKNIGTVFGEDGAKTSLPLIYAVGAQFYTRSQARFMLDLNKPMYGNYSIRAGMEYRVNRDFFIRGGYRFLQDEAKHWINLLRDISDDYTREDFNTWSAGIGLRLNKNTLLDLAVSGTTFETFPLISTSLVYSLK